MVSAFLRRGLRARRIWVVSTMWVVLAVVLGVIGDDLGARLIGDVTSPMSSESATATLSALASGMIAFTGMVFSLVFVVLQFGSSQYSPRIVREIDRQATVLGHSFGVFTGTFVYALLAIRTVDLAGSPGANTAVIAVALAWLLGSVFLFLRLVPRIQTLSITRILVFLDRAGREAIARSYQPATTSAATPPRPEDLPPVSQVFRHTGPAQTIQYLDTDDLVALARHAGGIVMVPHAVGDFIAPHTPVAVVLGGSHPIPRRRLRRAIILGPDRALYADPAYALRLLVDIAIRALSPAVNDPTTAVQSLDRIGPLLAILGGMQLDAGRVTDADGQLRLIYSQPTWEDLLLLGLIEIQQYGEGSVQIQRRVGALLKDLEEAVPASRRAAVRAFIARHRASLPATFEVDGLIPEGAARDRQGLGHTIA